MGNACPCAAGVAKSVSTWKGDSMRSSDGDSSPKTMAGSKTSSRSMATFANNQGKHPEVLYTFEKNKKAADLGTGAFGTVKKATNKKTGQVVAIKQIERNPSNQKGIDYAVLKNEIELNTMMDHPNIVRMYDTFEDKRYVWIAMEVCDGGELFDIIINQGSLHEGESAVIMEQVFRALNYMHNHSVAHRDLKPENFMLSKAGQKRTGGPGVSLIENTLKVIDFGIAKRFKPGEPKPFHTKVGTPYYIAPEVLDTKPRYNEKCDTWSCGVILYILLSGSPPFAGENDKEIMAAVKRASVSFKDPDFAKVSADAKDLILKCVEKNVQKRFTAQDALGTAWIKKPWRKNNYDHSAGASMNVVAKLKAFSSASRFKKAAINIIAHHIDDNQIMKLRQTFTQMDTDGDGELTLEELKAGCQQHGDIDGLADILSSLDTDGNGTIGYSEFLSAMLDQRTVAKRQQCWEAFRVFDKDGDGKITMKEFDEIMKDYDATGVKDVKPEDLAVMFREADADGDGSIDFDEFCAMMEKN